MNIRRRSLSVLVALVALNLTACNESSPSGGATGANPPPAPPSQASNVESPAELAQTNARIPTGVPPAALDSEPLLAEPAASVWPFRQGAPRTSGTGRYAFGAFYWTDFLYDATGALGPNPPLYHPGTPTGGSMMYPDEEGMAGNGADIFRVGIGIDDNFTYWRVDWQTLLDASVPVAAFAIDHSPELGSEAWPAVPRLNSGGAGIDAVLLISANGVFLQTPAAVAAGLPPSAVGTVAVDMAARSFVAKIPVSRLRPSGSWRLWLAAGLNDGSGGFRDDMPAFRGLPTQPPVFNLGFRDYADEPALNNFWFNQTQATQLLQGDAAPFVQELDWARVAASVDHPEPEPMPTGPSSRWYVASVYGVALGGGQEAGVYTGPDGATANPQYFDQVQPYGIFVPSTYSVSVPSKFTLMLHSLTQNHNQYSATVPNFQFDACEARNSICLTTLGRGPAGSYRGAAEVDLWDAWHDVARHYNLDTERTISSGYSMGAIATINLMIRYPQVFAGGVVLAGSHVNSELSLTALEGDVQTGELLENILWNGYYHAHGTFDELVPFPDARATVDAIKNYGYRYTFDHYVVEDHIIWTLKDNAYSAFAEAAKWMTNLLGEDDAGTRKQNPGEIRYVWRPAEVDPELGIGPQGPWWVSEIAAADPAQEFAKIYALSEAIAEAQYAPAMRAPTLTPVLPSPALREEQYWELGELTETTGTLRLDLTNIGKLTIDMAQAQLASHADRLLCVSTDVAGTELTLLGLANGVRLRSGDVVLGTVAGHRVTISLAQNSSAVTFSDSSATPAECIAP